MEIDQKASDTTENRSAFLNDEDYYKDIVEGQTELICRFNSDYNLTFVNGAFCNYFHLKRKDIIGQSFMDVIHEEDREFFQALLSSLGRKNPVATAENRVILPNRDMLWQQWTNRAIFDHKGIIVEYQSVGRDITERMQAEKFLRQSQKNYEKLARNANDAIAIIMGKDGRHVFVNKRMEEISGYTKSDLLKMSFREVIHPDELGKINQRYNKRMAGNKITNRFETKLVNKQGKAVPVEISDSITDWQGQAAVLAIIRDISEHQKAEADLRDSENNFRALAENANDGIVLIGAEGNFIYANSSFAETSGYNLDELLTFGFEKLADPSEREIMEDRLRRRLKGENVPQNYETKLICKSGRAVPIEVSGAKTIWQGDPAGLIIIRDITLRKQMEKSLRISENDFRAMAENANDGFILATGEGVHVYANERFAQISGYSVAELLKIGFRELTPRYEAEAIMKKYQKRLAGENVPAQYGAHLVRKDGVIIPIEVSASKTTWHGKPVVLEIISDISDRKKKEEQQKRARDELKRLVDERTSELVGAAEELEFKHNDLLLHKSELEKVNRELLDTNKALMALAKNIDREKEDAEKKIVQIVRSRVMPILEEFQRNPSFEKYRMEIDELMRSLSDLTPGLKDSADIILSLSSTELRIAAMIKTGLTSPEIANLQHLSLDTIKTHRRNIRKKLKINNSKINLATFLEIKMG